MSYEDFKSRKNDEMLSSQPGIPTKNLN